MDKNIVVPLALFACVTYGVKLLVDARMRYLFFKGDSPDAVRTLLQGEERMRRMASLRWGVILLALAIGLALVRLFDIQEINPASLALMLGAAGAGNLAGFALSARVGDTAP